MLKIISESIGNMGFKSSLQISLKRCLLGPCSLFPSKSEIVLFIVGIPLLGLLGINSLLLGNSNVDDNMAMSSLVTQGSNQVQSSKMSVKTVRLVFFFFFY